MRGRRSLCSILFFMLTFGANGFAQDTGEAPEPQSPEERQRYDFTQFLYTENGELNTSLAVHKEHGRIYLIVEVDHNFNRNEFTFDLSLFGSNTQKGIQVVKRNQPFGFNNKFVAVFPMIEIASSENSPAQKRMFDLESGYNRTQQQIDITALLEKAANFNALVDGEGQVYRVNQIHELSFLMTESFEGEPKALKPLRINLDNLSEGETRSLYGEIEVTDLPIEKFAGNDKTTLKVSPDVLSRYFFSIFQEFANGLFGLDRLQKIEKILQSLPIDFEENQKKELADKVHRAQSPDEIMKLVMSEQIKTQMKPVGMFCHQIYQKF